MTNKQKPLNGFDVLYQEHADIGLSFIWSSLGFIHYSLAGLGTLPVYFFIVYYP